MRGQANFNRLIKASRDYISESVYQSSQADKRRYIEDRDQYFKRLKAKRRAKLMNTLQIGVSLASGLATGAASLAALKTGGEKLGYTLATGTVHNIFSSPKFKSPKGDIISSEEMEMLINLDEINKSLEEAKDGQ